MQYRSGDKEAGSTLAPDYKDQCAYNVEVQGTPF